MNKAFRLLALAGMVSVGILGSRSFARGALANSKTILREDFSGIVYAQIRTGKFYLLPKIAMPAGKVSAITGEPISGTTTKAYVAFRAKVGNAQRIFGGISFDPDERIITLVGATSALNVTISVDENGVPSKLQDQSNGKTYENFLSSFVVDNAVTQTAWTVSGGFYDWFISSFQDVGWRDTRKIAVVGSSVSDGTISISSYPAISLQSILDDEQRARPSYISQGLDAELVPGSKKYDQTRAGTYSYRWKLTGVNTKTGGELYGILDIVVGDESSSGTADTAGKTELKSGANQDFYVLAGSSMTVDKILSGVSAVDLFGGQATVTVPDADKAAVDFNKAGSYVLHLTAADVYGQAATATITVHVIVPDSAAPVISRVDGKDAAKASIGLSAFKAKDFAAAKAEFLGQYQAVDAVDGKVALDATGFPASLDDLKGKAGKAVQVTLTATDKAGNKATQEVELTLAADALPVFYVDSWLVATTPDQPLTPDDVKALVYSKSAAADGADIHDIEIDAEDYLAHANEPGTYAVGFQYVTPDLTLAKGTVSVMVL